MGTILSGVNLFLDLHFAPRNKTFYSFKKSNVIFELPHTDVINNRLRIMVEFLLDEIKTHDSIVSHKNLSS